MKSIITGTSGATNQKHGALYFFVPLCYWILFARQITRRSLYLSHISYSTVKLLNHISQLVWKLGSEHRVSHDKAYLE